MNHVLVQFCQHKRNENPQYIDMSFLMTCFVIHSEGKSVRNKKRFLVYNTFKYSDKIQ